MIRFALVIGLFLLPFLAGCSSKLETGYEPRKLNASNEKRRAFYAAPFTPEARAGAGDDDRNDDPRYRKPGY